MSAAKPFALALIGCLAAGCEVGFDAGPARPDGGVRDAAPPLPPCEGLCVGPAEQTRITALEYQTSVVAALGGWPDVSRLPADGTVGGMFTTNETATLLVDDADRYRLSAESIAEAYLTGVDESGERTLDVALSALPGCATRDAACAAELGATLGARLFRRALSTDERGQLLELTTWTLAPETDPELVNGAGGSFEDAVRYVIERLLQSPQFLYRTVVGTPVAGRDDVVALTSEEMATRLAAFLLRSGPDDALRTAGERGELTEPAAIEAHTRRLMAENDNLWWFFAQEWLSTLHIETSAVQALDTEGIWTPEVPSQLLYDVHHTFAHVARNDGHLRTLLTSAGGEAQGPHVNEAFLGVTGEWHAWIDEVPGRHGILTLPGVLIANGRWGFTHAHQRGLFVRRRLLCQDVGSPSADIAAAVARASNEEAVVPSAPTHRARLEWVTERNPRCANCHSLTNPVGYAFDRYDAFGRNRTEELGSDGESYPIDASGVLAGRTDGELATDVDGPFADGDELLDRLADSETVARCMTTHFARFALQREPIAYDRGSIESAYARFEASDYDLRELVVALTVTDAFRYRGIPRR